MHRFFRSFRHACRGIGYAFQNEHNFQIELVFAVLVLALALFFDLSSTEQTVLFLVVSTVLTLELLNTAIERLVDMMKPRVHPYAKIVKDIMAGSVLVSALFALLSGFVIFLPHLEEFLH